MFEIFVKFELAGKPQDALHRVVSGHSSMSEANAAFERILPSFKALFDQPDQETKFSGMRSASWQPSDIREACVTLSVAPAED